MADLAAHMVETKDGHFKPEEFGYHYEEALKEVLKKKQAGEKIEVPKQREPAKVISLMDALRRSVQAERAAGRAARMIDGRQVGVGCRKSLPALAHAISGPASASA